ncbi:MAG: hypothetical protein ACPLQS_04000 [Desulfurococcaceae archaeon]
MKKLVEDVCKRIDDLLNTLRNRGLNSSLVSSIVDLKNNIINVRVPTIPSRALWDKYTHLIMQIEEANKVASTPGYEHIIHNVIVSLREQIMDFKNTLSKSYLTERVQLALPPILGAIYALIRVLGENASVSFILLPIALISVILSGLKAIYGLIGSGVLGLVFIVVGGDLGSVFTGTLLIAIAAIYIYILSITSTRKFQSRVQNVLVGINKVIDNMMTPSNINVDDVLSKIVENSGYNVDDSGLFKFIDRNELLRYKAVLLIALGLVPRASRPFNNISQK